MHILKNERQAMRKIIFSTAVIILLLLILAAESYGQGVLNVTFRYIKNPQESFVRVFVPGTMPVDNSLDWGPNSSGFISPSAPSLMVFDPTVDAYVRSYELSIGAQYEYKFHFHYNQSGSNWRWISDPLNPVTFGPNQNSIITVSNPFIFEPTRHQDENGLVTGLSVGIFTDKPIDHLTYVIGSDTLNGTDNINSDGIFYAPITPPRSIYERYLITATIDGQDYVAYDQPAIEIVESSRPADTRFGVNVQAKKAIFVVHAPAQPFMQVLVGKPNVTLTPADAKVMNKALGETDIWWLETSLTAGEYEYQYLLPDGRRISDPFSRRVRNNQTVFDIGPGGVSTADDYPWQDSGFIRPDLDTLLIYELHLDDFAAKGSAQGRFIDLIDRLDYLDSLGINAVELMPIMEFPGDRSWGYNTSHYTAVEATYGTPWQFKQLVDAAHQRNIAVILDIVWNHMDGSGPLWQIQPDYVLNPYFKADDDLRPHETQIGFGGVDLDHFTAETQAFVREVDRIWIEEYHADGFRFDFTRGIGWDLAQPQFGILGWSAALRILDATAYQIAEHLPADPYLIRVSDLDAGWNDSFHDQLINDIYGPVPTLSTISAMILGLHEYNSTNPGYDNRTQTVKATVTHDEQSLIQEMVRFKGISLPVALQRDLLYSAMTFTSLGIPMIWQGQELGMQSGWNDDNQNGNWDEEKLAYRPMKWSLIGTERGDRHFQFYRKLIALRKRNSALFQGIYQELWRYNAERVLVYGYEDTTSSTNENEIMAVANFSGSEQTVTNVPWLSVGDWQDVLDDSTVFTTISDTIANFTIAAYSIKLFSKILNTQVAENNLTKAPMQFSLYQNYPNPFNSSTTIQFNLQHPEVVTLKIYSALGNEVCSLLNKKDFAAGSHNITWDAENLPSGIYFYRLKTASEVSTKKLILLQ